MSIIIVILSIVFSSVIATFLKQVFKTRFNVYVTYFIMLSSGLVAGLLSLSTRQLPVSYTLGYLMLTIIIPIVFKVNLYQTLFAAGSTAINMLSVRGLVISTLAIFTQKDLFVIVQDSESNRLAIAIMFGLAAIELVIFQLIYKPSKVNTLLKSAFVMPLAFLTLFIDILLVLKANFYYFQIVHDSFAFYNFTFDILILITYFFCFDYFMSKVNIHQNSLQLSLLEEQLLNQIQLYHQQETYVTGLRRFKHDYFAMKQGINYLLQNKQYDRIEDYLDASDICFDDLSGQYKIFSNHVIVQGVLLDLYLSCQKNNIEFDGSANIDDSTLSLSDLDICRVFKNVANNALEACIRDKKTKDKHIKISTNVKNNWLVINIENTFDGVIKKEDDKILTTKKGNSHGFGITNVKNIIENANGQVAINISTRPTIFKISIMLPNKSK